MSTLNVSNITDGTTTVDTSYVVNGSAKAWVNYNISTVQDSLNVSSLTDNAQGDHTANFSNSFSSANHVPTTGGRFDSSFHGLVSVGDRAAGSVDLFGMTGGSTATYLGSSYKSDIALVAAAVHGDLA
jgi:hypothetical protein